MYRQNLREQDVEPQRDRASLSTSIERHSLILIVIIIKLYQFLLAPLWPSKCRFYPTCSSYAIEALQRKGLRKGLWLTIIRILRCNPLFFGGYDPVR